MSVPADLPEKLAAYLTEKWQRPVRVEGMRRFHGGAGRETYRFDALSGEQLSGEHRDGLVLRRDPPKSIIETERAPEYRALELFHGTDVPVPEPLFLEEGDRAFGSPGFIMREIEGAEAAGLFEENPFGEARERIGEEFFGILGRIHMADPDALGLQPVSAAERVRHWQAVIEEDAVQPEPVAAAAARWLLANLPPAPQRQAVVHGDYRRGNFLTKEGRVAAILDWEMVHVGDPLEDLAWACDPLWAGGSDLAAGTLPEQDAVSRWEEASGLSCEARAFAWWRMFAAYMGLAIWISSAAEAANLRSLDPVVAWAGLVPYRQHNLALATMLRDRAA